MSPQRILDSEINAESLNVETLVGICPNSDSKRSGCRMLMHGCSTGLGLESEERERERERDLASCKVLAFHIA